MDVCRLSVPPMLKLWQELQEMKPDLDSLGSKKSFLPSSTFALFLTGATEIGWMGSSDDVAAQHVEVKTSVSAVTNVLIFMVIPFISNLRNRSMKKTGYQRVVGTCRPLLFGIWNNTLAQNNTEGYFIICSDSYTSYGNQ
jgi:ACR3 family arsenite efflux pump ArsB